MFENVVLPKYNGRWEKKRKKTKAKKNKKQVKPEETILLNGKMVLVLGKALHSNGGAE